MFIEHGLLTLLTSSEYGFKHNLSQIKKLGLFRLAYYLY